MPPSLLLVRIGPVPVLFPVFLLWPLVALVWIAAWIAALPVGRAPRDRRRFRAVLAALEIFCRTRGVRANVRPQKGPGIRLQLF